MNFQRLNIGASASNSSERIAFRILKGFRMVGSPKSHGASYDS